MYAATSIKDGTKEPAGHSGEGTRGGPLVHRQTAKGSTVNGGVYFRARYYSAEEGRFLSRDPVWDAGNVGGWYSFVGNGPVSGMDPLGLQRPTPEAESFWGGVYEYFKWRNSRQAMLDQSVGAGKALGSLAGQAKDAAVAGLNRPGENLALLKDQGFGVLLTIPAVQFRPVPDHR